MRPTGGPWQVRVPDGPLVEALSLELGLPTFVSQVLAARGFASAESAARHLRADLREMPAPSRLLDCEKGARRLALAIQRRERIVVYGDYDVDGVTSTALLQLFFQNELGYPIGAYIPHRMREGYGLNREAITRLANEGAELLLTVDNGSAAVEEIAHARDLGLDVIVIDHHQVGEPEPNATAHLNPHRRACGFPEKVLAAVGVAFYLIVELRRVLREAGHFAGRPEPRPDRYLDLVALGTVADVAPLTGVNRALVRQGLELLRQRPRIGLRALLEAARIDPGAVTARDLGFKLGPRINAAGRMDDATRGLTLLTTDDPAVATTLAALVEAQNDERRAVEQGMTQDAIRRVEALGEALPAALVLWDEAWHPGVVGIVAARLVDRFQRPAVLLAWDGAHFKGSARSVRGVHLKDTLDRCGPHLVRWGGHAAAAGVTVTADRVAAFADAFAADVGAGRTTGAPSGPVVDAVAALGALDSVAVHHLERLGPFGEQNPAPMILVPAVSGRTRVLPGAHLKLELSPADVPREALGWGMGDVEDLCRGPVDLLCTPEVETYRGRRRVVLRLHDVRRAESRG
jgi:single-stranded-DNA-specific exonuclease